ncbi:MAG: hypothetical protein HONBIEJF_01210 [Fimbriimonadaceae bacterium]|nr:hypothetical protein [Fimbriimonadaceae bacterium]
MIGAITAVFMFGALSLNAPPPVNDVVGKYTAQIFVDESIIPANAGDYNETQYRKGIASLRKTKGNLELLPGDKFKMLYSGPSLKKPLASSGTWSRKDDHVTLVYTGAKGKPLKKAITLVLQIRQEGVLVHNNTYGPNSMTVYTKVK